MRKDILRNRYSGIVNVLFLFCAVIFYCCGCGDSGGGDGGSGNPGNQLAAGGTDLTGYWYAHTTVLSGDCGDTEYPYSITEDMQIKQNGNNISMILLSTGATVSGTISGNKIEFGKSIPGDEGTSTYHLSTTLSKDANTFSGNGKYEWAGTEPLYSCSETLKISATPIGTMTNVSSIDTIKFDYIEFGTALAFDGTYFWITNQDNDTIYKVDSSFRAITSFSAPGYEIAGMTHDGANLWVAEESTQTIYQLDNEGNIISSFFFSDVKGLTFDGTYLWVTTLTDFSMKDSICKIDTVGNVIDCFDAPDVTVYGLSYDGEFLWTTSENTIYKLKTDGTIIESIFSYLGGEHCGLTFDGTCLWAAQQDTSWGSNSSSLYQLDMTGNVISRLGDDDMSEENYFHSLSVNGTNIWTIADDTIYKVDSNGNVISQFSAPDDDMKSLDFDGTSLWAADNDSIYKLDTSGNVVKSFNVPGVAIEYLACRGTDLWVAGTENSIYQLNMDGNLVSSFSIGDDGTINGMSYDGVYLWVAYSSFFTIEKIYKIDTTGNILKSYFLPEFIPPDLPANGTGETAMYAYPSGSIVDIAHDGECLWYTEFNSIGGGFTKAKYHD